MYHATGWCALCANRQRHTLYGQDGRSGDCHRWVIEYLYLGAVFLVLSQLGTGYATVPRVYVYSQETLIMAARKESKPLSADLGACMRFVSAFVRAYALFPLLLAPALSLVLKHPSSSPSIFRFNISRHQPLFRPQQLFGRSGRGPVLSTWPSLLCLAGRGHLLIRPQTQ